VLRTDFSDEACWRSICAEVLAETADGFRAYVDVVEDRAFDGFGTDDVLATVGDDYRWGYLVVGDRLTMTQAEHPFLVLDLLDERGRSFRALPREIQAIENTCRSRTWTSRSSPTRLARTASFAASSSGVSYAVAAAITPASGRGTRSGSSASTSNGG